MIEIKNLTKQYWDADKPKLKDINATINKGDVIAIIGPSGTGKSTFLCCINLLSKASSGQILFDGVDLMDPSIDIRPYRKKIGMVFQSFNLFNHMTVLENVMLPQMDLLGRTRQEAYDKAIEYLELVGMESRKLYYPNQLSGGQKQRVAIARTVAMDPEVILFDEPTSALDPAMVGEVEFVIKQLAAQGRTMMIVTHEMRFARQVSNRIFYMDQGGLYEEGPTEEIFTNPKRDRTRRFVNRLKSLEIKIDSDKFSFVDTIGEIEKYGEKLELSSSRIKNAERLFEKFCVDALLPTQLPNPDILAIFEYDDNEDTLTLMVSHPGELIKDNLDEADKKLIEELNGDVKLIEKTFHG